MKRPHDIDSVDQTAQAIVSALDTQARDERRLYKQEVSDLKQLVASKDATISEQEERLKRYTGVGKFALYFGMLVGALGVWHNYGDTILRALASLWGLISGGKRW